MTATKLTRLVLPAACAFGLLAAPALAQTTPAPGASTMAPAASGSTMAPAHSTTMAPATSGKTTATGSATMSSTTGSMAPASSMSKMSGMKLSSTDEFKTTAAATAHCPGDTVVWSTLSKSKSYHMASSKYYGKTKHGAYVCEKDATAAGFHASKS